MKPIVLTPIILTSTLALCGTQAALAEAAVPGTIPQAAPGAPSVVLKDTDGDGLPDRWEKYGYDYNGDGKIDVNLPRLGADWKKKDIFIAYAWMQASGSETKSHEPTSDVLKAIKAAFAAAHVTNPNRTTGINVHFIDKGSVPHDDDLNPVWTEFDTLMDPKVTVAERKVFHRLLCAHAYNSGTSSGLSRGIPASDFIETLGGWSTNPGTFKQRAGTIMHELGHNIGLRHGGVDDENYKPNHLSIMSYFNQVDWVLNKTGAKLDYERFDLTSLDENHLNEVLGLDRVGGDTPIKDYGVRWFDTTGTPRSKASTANRNDDWNWSTDPTDTDVAVDLNNSGSKSVLKAGFVEWSHLIFDGGEIGAGTAQAKAQITAPQDLIELTEEEYLNKVVPLRGQPTQPVDGQGEQGEAK